MASAQIGCARCNYKGATAHGDGRHGWTYKRCTSCGGRGIPS